MTEGLEARLKRLEEERAEADRRYNEALTELDRALPRGAADPARPIDDQQLPALNDAWNIVPAPPSSSGLKQKLTGFIWRTVGPYLQRQLTFNSLLVDHLNRNAEALQRAHAQETSVIRAQLDAIAAFHARLLAYLQQITAYVDTRDRHSSGGSLILNAAISDVAEGQAKYHESLAAREYRYAARTTALATAHEELRAMIGTAQGAITALKRHVEGGARDAGSGVRNSGSEVRDSRHGDSGSAAFAPALDAYKYVGFEDQFRGSQEIIRARQESYVPFFEGLRRGSDARTAGHVLDVGCGRGEFIELLNARGIPAQGLDLNHEMTESCRARGLDVVEADAVGYLSAQPDASLGGIFAAQVVEHLEPSYLLRFLDLAFEKLQPGGTLVLETLNPACWTAFFESYIRDITHRWPLHPDTLKYLVTASGFTRVSVEFRSPVPPQDRLQPIAVAEGADAALRDIAEAFNGNVEKLNARMFTHMDYAVVGVKVRATAV